VSSYARSSDGIPGSTSFAARHRFQLSLVDGAVFVRVQADAVSANGTIIEVVVPDQAVTGYVRISGAPGPGLFQYFNGVNMKHIKYCIRTDTDGTGFFMFSHVI